MMPLRGCHREQNAVIRLPSGASYGQPGHNVACGTNVVGKQDELSFVGELDGDTKLLRMNSAHDFNVALRMHRKALVFNDKS